MTTSVIFCLSYDLSKERLTPIKWTLFQRKMHCCHGRRHDVTCFRRKCYVTCGHNIIYDMTLSTELKRRHMIRRFLGEIKSGINFTVSNSEITTFYSELFSLFVNSFYHR